MPCEVAAHPFQAHANYANWSIDFDVIRVQKSCYDSVIMNLDLRP